MDSPLTLDSKQSHPDVFCIIACIPFNQVWELQNILPSNASFTFFSVHGNLDFSLQYLVPTQGQSTRANLRGQLDMKK